MPFIEWKNDFFIGIPSVDHEHQELIALINYTFASLVSARDERKVTDFLGELHARISAHFALEEKVMRERDYDEYQDHKDDHERLLDDIRDIMDGCEDNPQFDQDAFAERLSLWFTEHFRTKDARLHTQLG